MRTNECPCVHIEKYVGSVLTSARNVAARAPIALIHIVETRRAEGGDGIVCLPVIAARDARLQRLCSELSEVGCERCDVSPLAAPANGRLQSVWRRTGCPSPLRP